ncbi:uncharacterized protein LOC129731185 isoform X2 [Wyeomyia smithii]|uniref:uncharacterized protein LOC129731185 isoform X2 n=1 Tax=Wyeomyia smithii TaxID=174621 RepID=UPI002467CCE3|nr:uncharacterized protein LOC129731185 isoform X2 [Wyeomyia smithii]
MAKEMMIVFVYDTVKNDEFEDPVKSVIYFHPPWVSETQKLLLCGQLMAVGSDRNISKVVLEHRANFLYALVKMYHGDFDVLYRDIDTDYQQAKFSDKVYNILESYLPLMQCNGNIFQNVSSLKIPKSASTLYLETTQILQSFQQTVGVLGGTILYHNKVVASQLSDNLTKIITVSDLYRPKCSEHISANYHIPIGVSLINAYIPASEYADLVRVSNQSFNLFSSSTTKDAVPFPMRKKSFSRDSHSVMKRVKSLIFTNIPEEDIDDGVTKQTKKNTISRPTHLPLIFKNSQLKETMESGFNSINFDESDSFPSFIGKTSVCSTPMTENKLLPNGNLLSICAVNEDDTQADLSKYSEYVQTSENLDLNENRHKDPIKIKASNIHCNSIINNRLRASYSNIREFISLDDAIGDPITDSRNTKSMHRHKRGECYSKTVTDPMYPIYNSKGNLISYSLFKELLELNYNELKAYTSSGAIPDRLCYNPDVETECANSVNKNERCNETCVVPEDILQRSSKHKRKGLTLPLKSLSTDKKNIEMFEHGVNRNVFNSPIRRRNVSGLQLTPLMSKLTVLAMNDSHSSGFSSWDTTPGYNLNNPLTPLEANLKRKKNICPTQSNCDCEDPDDNELSQLVKVELFICVQQNMTLVLMLQEKSCEQEDMIHSLFETCVSKLCRIENSLNQAMSIDVEGCNKGDGSYSFICLDSKWDVNNRYGPWSPNDLLILNSLHNDFYYNRKLIEMILRTQDAVIYAYRCGRSEIYYQQSSLVIPGLPPPQDTMGTIALCAKRRLERDHKILLL